MTATPKSSWPWVKALLHSIYDQPDARAQAVDTDKTEEVTEHDLQAITA